MKSKVKQSTEKPILGEMRLISGQVMVWTAKGWVTEKQWEQLTSI